MPFFNHSNVSPGFPFSQRSTKQQAKNTKTPQDIKATETIATNTNEEINNACLRGAIARDVADQQLLDPHQRAQNQADAALPLPRENTAAMGRHFSDTFPGDGQPQAAIQTAPPINSRTGQQPSIATNEQPRRVITTDAHARIIAPPRQRGNSKNNSCGGGRSGTTTTTHWRRFRTTPRRDSGTQRATTDLQHDPGNDQAEDFGVQRTIGTETK